MVKKECENLDYAVSLHTWWLHGHLMSLKSSVDSIGPLKQEKEPPDTKFSEGYKSTALDISNFDKNIECRRIRDFDEAMFLAEFQSQVHSCLFFDLRQLGFPHQ